MILNKNTTETAKYLSQTKGVNREDNCNSLNLSPVTRPLTRSQKQVAGIQTEDKQIPCISKTKAKKATTSKSTTRSKKKSALQNAEHSPKLIKETQNSQFSKNENKINEEEEVNDYKIDSDLECAQRPTTSVDPLLVESPDSYTSVLMSPFVPAKTSDTKTNSFYGTNASKNNNKEPIKAVQYGYIKKDRPKFFKSRSQETKETHRIQSPDCYDFEPDIVKKCPEQPGEDYLNVSDVDDIHLIVEKLIPSKSKKQKKIAKTGSKKHRETIMKEFEQSVATAFGFDDREDEFIVTEKQTEVSI